MLNARFGLVAREHRHGNLTAVFATHLNQQHIAVPINSMVQHALYSLFTQPIISIEEEHVPATGTLQTGIPRLRRRTRSGIQPLDIEQLGIIALVAL